MTDEPKLTERSLARKYGLRELVYPDGDQLRLLTGFLSDSRARGRIGQIPKTAVLVMYEFVQATLNRQYLTKGPGMSPAEFDLLQAPFYLATRVVTKLAREKKEQAELRGRTYQITHANLNLFVELLRNLMDPTWPTLRSREIPEKVENVMELLQDFAVAFSEQRKRGKE